jgi:predicted nuclease of predicted toxin-antitoxin system
VRDRGLLAATDAEVLDRAYDEDRVLVTANVGDASTLEGHDAEERGESIRRRPRT